MIAVGVRELKNRLSHFLRLVKNGEEVLVTDRGVVVATLRQPGEAEPPADEPDWLRHLVAQGRARPAAHRVAPDLYVPVGPVGDSMLERLNESRGDR